MLSAFFLALFVGCIIVAIVNDLWRMEIPNWVSIVLTLAFLPAAMAVGLSWGDIGSHYLTGVIGLVVCFALFAFGVWGGGDAKLVPAILIWMGPVSWMQFIFALSVIGGIQIVLILFSRKFVPQAVFPEIVHEWVYGGRMFPYAVAIGGGAYWVMLAGAPFFELLMNRAALLTIT